jgi:WD40 repeat protein
MMMGAGAAAMFEDSKGQQEKPEEDNAYEEWRNKRTWIRHVGGVSDLAWSPDSIHFASCGTDSQIIIWSINEGGKIS